jgi:hypothetical protein
MQGGAVLHKVLIYNGFLGVDKERMKCDNRLTKETTMSKYKAYGIKNGGSEKFVATITSASEGKTTHNGMKVAGYFDTIVVRNNLDQVVMRKELKEEENVDG